MCPIGNSQTASRWRVGLFAALAAVVLGPSASDAAFIRFDLNADFGPPTPVKANNTLPYYLRIDLQDAVDGTGAHVLATFTANLAVNGNQRIDFARLNLTAIPGGFTFDSPTGPAALSGVTVAANSFVLPGAGGTNRFDMDVDFDQSGTVPNANALDGADVFSVKFRGTGLTASSFVATNQAGPIYAGAHVIGIGLTGSVGVFTEDFINNPSGNPDPTVVPAPAGLLLGLLGAASLGGYSVRRGRRA